MIKKTIIGGVGAAILGIGLLWFSGHGSTRGIDGWETLNVGMARTLASENKATISQAPSKPLENLAPVATDQGIAANSTPESAAQDEALNGGKVNVNKTEVNGLMKLPGIGAKKAQAIIEYRGSHGPFKTLSDLGKVKGIGPKMLEKLKAMVSF